MPSASARVQSVGASSMASRANPAPSGQWNVHIRGRALSSARTGRERKLEITTIGFTQSSAEHFFERLRHAGVTRVLDVRLHNVSQLAGFAKGKDLDYFTQKILAGVYEHDLRLAPTDELLGSYRKDHLPWSWYERKFLELMAERNVPRSLDRGPFDRNKTALVCSEATASRCHRRLVAELLQEAWGARVVHL